MLVFSLFTSNLSLYFQVTFNALKSAELKPVELLIPIEVREGPAYVVKLKANVLEPTIDLSRTCA